MPFTDTGTGNLTNNMKQQMQPIRVLEVLNRMDRGGAETMIMNLYRKIDRSRVQLDFVVHSQKQGFFDDEIKELGGRIFLFPRFTVLNYFSYKKAWRQFFMAHPEYHVVHGHKGSTAAIYLHEANKAGLFSIAHSHSAGGGITWNGIIYKFFSWPTRFIAKQMFGCSTEAGIARYGKRIIASSNYQNFPNGIDLKKFEFHQEIRQKVRTEFGLAADQILIIHVGRLTEAKNPEMILNVFTEIVRNNLNALCLWVGTGELEAKYRKRIIEGGLQKRILMTGVRTDIPQLLQGADVFLFPSLWEGLPVSVIEAQASGLPCVIADTISKEVQITPLVEWHSLSESPKQWAERCLALAKDSMLERCSPVDAIREAGYDIEKSVKWLEDYYIKVSNKNE